MGVNLVPSLGRRYGVVRVLDDLSIGDIDTLKREWADEPGGGELEFIRADIRDSEAVESAAHGVDHVVHLAAQSGVISSIEDPGFDYSLNVLGTFNILEAARKSGVERVVFASSNAAAGQQSPPVNEMGVPRPASPYGASKLAAEGYCSAYSEAYGLETVALRFANAYGPHSTHKTSVIARFLSLALGDESISIYGDGSQTRDFVYVEDLCRAIRLALDGEGVRSGVYQIGTGVETSVNDLVATLERVLGKTFQKTNLPARRGEVQRMFLDITKARTLLGYEPGVSLREGLEETCRWFISNSESPVREGS